MADRRCRCRDNARHLWRRSSDRLKGPGSPLSGLWTVGKHLWNRSVFLVTLPRRTASLEVGVRRACAVDGHREITQVYGALQGPWPSELQGLVERLQGLSAFGVGWDCSSVSALM